MKTKTAKHLKRNFFFKSFYYDVYSLEEVCQTCFGKSSSFKTPMTVTVTIQSELKLSTIQISNAYRHQGNPAV